MTQPKRPPPPRRALFGLLAAIIALSVALAVLLSPRAPAQELEAAQAYKVGREPIGLALSSDGKTLYAANAADGSVSAVPLEGGATRTFKVSDKRLNSLAASSDGKALYVSQVEDGLVYALELPSGGVRGQVRVGDFPQGLLLSSDGNTLYSADTGSDTVSQVDTRSLTRVSSVPVGERPFGLAFDPQGNVVVTGNNGALARLSKTDLTVLEPFNLPDLARLLRIKVAPDGQIYVADGLSGEILSLGPKGNRKLDPAPGNAALEFSPTDVAVSEDGSRLYAVGRSGWLATFDAQNQRALAPLELGGDLRQMVVGRDGRIYATDFSGGRVVSARVKR